MGRGAADEVALAWGRCVGWGVAFGVESQCVLDPLVQDFKRRWLGDEVEGAELERADGGVDAAVGADYRHRQAGVVGLDLGDQLERKKEMGSDTIYLDLAA